jgi:hypothetical protein
MSSSTHLSVEIHYIVDYNEIFFNFMLLQNNEVRITGLQKRNRLKNF